LSALVSFAATHDPRAPNKAVLAVAATLLTAAYHMLKYGVEYRPLAYRSPLRRQPGLEVSF
jgi:hypothetical protein